MKVCPYLQYAFQVLGKKWNGLIIHYLSNCPNETAHFTDIKKDLQEITPRALSMKLTELIDLGLIKKNVSTQSAVSITYTLTDMGKSLNTALESVRQWAIQYKNFDEKRD